MKGFFQSLQPGRHCGLPSPNRLGRLSKQSMEPLLGQTVEREPSREEAVVAKRLLRLPAGKPPVGESLIGCGITNGSSPERRHALAQSQRLVPVGKLEGRLI